MQINPQIGEVPLPPIEELRAAFLDNVLPALVVAAILVALLNLIGWMAKRREAMAQLGAALGLAAGMTAACPLGALLLAHFSHPPEQTADPTLEQVFNDVPLPLTHRPGPAFEWLPWVLLAALLVSAIAHFPGVATAVGWTLRGAVAANAGWLLMPAGLREQYFWSPLVLGAVILAEWAVLEQLPWRGMMPLAAALAAVAASGLLIYAGSLRFNQAALILAGSLLGIGLAALAMRAPASAASAGVAVMLPGLLLQGGFENTTAVPSASFYLIALAPLVLALSLLPAWQRRQKQGLWLVQLVLFLLPLGIAIGLAVQNESLNYDEEGDAQALASPRRSLPIARLIAPVQVIQSSLVLPFCPSITNRTA
jgi:hypothetical protein